MQTVGQRYKRAVHKMPEISGDLAVPFAKVGIEVEVEKAVRIDDPNGVLSKWQHEQDGSLRDHGMEFKTNGAVIGKEIVDAIESICAFAKHNKFSDGYPRAGIHYHIDVTDMNEKSNTELLNMVLSYMLFEKAVFRFAGTWREGCGFCDPLWLSQKDFPHIATLLYDWEATCELNERKFSKYQAINFLPMARFGTIEFRQLPTTFDSKRMTDWLNICLSFKHYGMKVDRDPVQLLDSYGLDYLIEKVFGRWSGLLRSFIVPDEIAKAALDVRSLRIGKSFEGKKAGKPMLDSWDEPDNPLLLSKIQKAPKRKAKAEAVKKFDIDADMAAVANRLLGDPPRVRVRGETAAPNPLGSY